MIPFPSPEGALTIPFPIPAGSIYPLHLRLTHYRLKTGYVGLSYLSTHSLPVATVLECFTMIFVFESY